MAKLDGFSEEERKRIQVLRDKVRGDFNRAGTEQPRAKDAPANEQRRADATMNHVLTPMGQTRIEKTAHGQKREDKARDMVERSRSQASQQADKAQQRANVRKAFNRAHSHDRLRERDDFER